MLTGYLRWYFDKNMYNLRYKSLENGTLKMVLKGGQGIGVVFKSILQVSDC
jgi:hypothetical protein